jgi:ATP-dependent 26S proteasome regulatory subunit
VEIAVPSGSEGEAIARRLFERLERAIAEARSYRGKVLSLEMGPEFSGQTVGVAIHRLEPVSADEIILPRSTLAALERNVIGFAKMRDELMRLGMPLKKGLLFHGPPGTGKSYTIRYLAGALPDHTTLLVTAEQVGVLHEYVALARLLQPSILVIEDADLIARERTSMGGPCEESLLNRLLNEMDGLGEDARIFFVLTTNRPDSLKPAIASRPGRIDQAIEFPLPDVASRRRLAAIYARDLPVEAGELDEIAARTEGVSAAFIKELMRRAAQDYLGARATATESLIRLITGR